MTRAGITLVIEVEGKKDPNRLGFGLGRLLIRDANVGKGRIGWMASLCNWLMRHLCHSAGTAGMIAGGCEDSGAQVKLCPVRCFKMPSTSGDVQGRARPLPRAYPSMLNFIVPQEVGGREGKCRL